jgi:hypothetical protein
MKFARIYCLSASVLLLAPASVRAGSRKTGTSEVFALIVANNRSLQKHRPNLHYADDDGARYSQVFRSVAAAENVILLTVFDPATRKLYPKLAAQARPPRRRALLRAMTVLRRKMQRAKKRGRRVVFYFVFAGHGHVQHGKGYLELLDGRLGPRSIERVVLKGARADAIHLLLDSCNSFFVVSPRKPGGRRWATPKDLTRSFARRYPHVGVFLSTSGSGEVYEWSEIQSGIFSHEVRSGLTGAADADRNGRISYNELAAFVAVANRGIKNPHYRPKVVARAPGNKGNATLFAYKGARGRRIKLGTAARRLWIRDRMGTRMADLNKEAGVSWVVTIPRPQHETLYVQELHTPPGKDKDVRPVLRQYTIKGVPKPAAKSPSEDSAPIAKSSRAGPVVLARLTPGPAPAAARGHDAIFAQIFRDPYGPQAYRKYMQTHHRSATPYLGISWRDRIRMRHYLAQLAAADRQDRFLKGAALALVGGVLITVGGLALYDIKTGSDPATTRDKWILGAMMGSGFALLGWGVFRLAWPSEGERAYRAFLRELANPNATFESVVAQTEYHLQAMARRERTGRIATGVVAFVAGGAAAAAAIWLGISYRKDDLKDKTQITFGVGTGILSAAMIGLGSAMFFTKSPLERMLHLYRKDPDLNLRLTASPLPGGAAVALSGRF